MQTTSDLYKELLAKGAAKEVRVEVGGQIYDESSIVGLSTTSSLFVNDFLSAGGAVSRQFDLVLKNYGDIPKMAKIVPSYRLVDGEQSSEWIQKGVFYIDTRVPDKASGTLTIHGFDAMLKGSVLWEPSQDLVFPMTFRSAAQVIAGLMGVELDNPEDINDTYQILDYPANNYTQRNILQFIAAAHGANFVMTDLGKLRMVGINDIPVETSTLVNERGNSILIGGVRIAVGSSAENNLTGDGSKVFVGGMVASTGAPPAFDPITKVIVKVDEENAYFSGDETGRSLEVTCPYGTQEMADNILAKVKGYVYQPFTAEDALVDQAIELGDGITVDGVYTILAKQDILFDSLMAGLVAAPGQEEIESEYPYQTKEQQVDLRLAQAYSLISKTAEEIRLEVVKKLDTDEANTLISAAIGKIELSVSSKDGSTSFVLTDGTAEISAQTLNLTVPAVNVSGKLTASQIDATDLKVAAANVTGSLTIGQLPDDVAVQDDIPYFTSDLYNDSDFVDETGVVEIIDGTITADYINALGVSAQYLQGKYIYLLDADEYASGRLIVSDAETAAYAIDIQSYAGLRLLAESGMYFDSGYGTFIQMVGSESILLGNGDVYPSPAGYYSCGTASWYWSDVYSENAPIEVSDRNKKTEIVYGLDSYDPLFDALKPGSFLFKGGSSGRRHFGLIAQDVEETLTDLGYTTLDVAAFIKSPRRLVDGTVVENEYEYALRYGELIPLCIEQIQKLKRRVTELEAKA